MIFLAFKYYLLHRHTLILLIFSLNTSLIFPHISHIPCIISLNTISVNTVNINIIIPLFSLIAIIDSLSPHPCVKIEWVLETVSKWVIKSTSISVISGYCWDWGGRVHENITTIIIIMEIIVIVIIIIISTETGLTCVIGVD